MTGGRLKRLEKYLGNETFMLTYGDGLSNINLKKFKWERFYSLKPLEFSKNSKKSLSGEITIVVEPSLNVSV